MTLVAFDWILIVFVASGPYVSVTSVPGFYGKKMCEQAAVQVKQFQSPHMQVKTTCVPAR